MTKQNHLYIATSNPLRLSSSYEGCRKLWLIKTEEGALPQEQPILRAPEPIDFVKTWQVMLKAESAFLAQLCAYAEQKSKCGSDLAQMRKLRARLNNENIMVVARFFFLLRALKCNTPQSVEAFLKAHNNTIRGLIEAQDFSLRTEAELKKAAFTGPQIYACLETIGLLPRAAFTRMEIASLLFEHMGRDSVVRAIDALVEAGLLIETIHEPLKGVDRKLIHTDGALENAVEHYFAEIRRGVLEG